jgi:hypothetical protein
MCLRERRRSVGVMKSIRIAAVLLAAVACATPAASAATHTKPGKTIEGRFDVGGHKLYLRCVGGGPGPTIVYLCQLADEARR